MEHWVFRNNFGEYRRYSVDTLRKLADLNDGDVLTIPDISRISEQDLWFFAGREYIIELNNKKETTHE